MSKRRELQAHSDSLTDIGELMGAMKNLALVESRRIATFIDAQRAAAGIVETTLADFIVDYADHIPPVEPSGEVLCIIGSERGFCGDLNQRLIAAAEGIIEVAAHGAIPQSRVRSNGTAGSEIALGTGLRRHDGEESPPSIEALKDRHSGAGRDPELMSGSVPSVEAGTVRSVGNEAELRIVLVGSRLAGAWSGNTAASIPGAGFADEVPNILADLLDTLTRLLQAAAGHNTPALSLLYFTEVGPVRHTLLPVPSPIAGGKQRSNPLQLNLPPRQFHAALIDQFIETALGCALYDALLHENRLRLEHMEQARHRIDQQRDDLARRINRARQEEITEEIEIIMLSAIATDGD